MRGPLEPLNHRQRHRRAPLLLSLPHLVPIARRASSTRFNPKLLELGRLVKETVDDHRAEFRVKGLTLDVTTKELWVDADPMRLGEVLANVLVNALKVTPAGGQVSLSLVAPSTSTARALHREFVSTFTCLWRKLPARTAPIRKRGRFS